jgi:hypothetical protein
MFDINNIKIINNFMEVQDCNDLISACVDSANNPDNIWWYQKFPGTEYASHATGVYAQKCLEQTINYHDNKNLLLKKYMDKLCDLISYDIGKTLVPIFHFNRHEVKDGGETPVHTDAGSKSQGTTDYLSEYSPNHIYEPCLSEYTAIIYLNDDYVGGNLYFPDYDLEIKHSRGQLVYFPAGSEYSHGVKKVTEANRWNLVTHLTSPTLIHMHSIIYNMWGTMNSEQRKQFPESWQSGYLARGIG